MKKKIKENAEFDYGSMAPSKKMKHYDIKTHDFTSRQKGKVRYTGNYGDNAMEDSSKLNEDHHHDMLDRLEDMLVKAGVTEHEIRNGVSLSEKGTQKVSASLGISGSEVEMLLNSLAARMKDEPVTEGFSYEQDVMNNVTVRDEDADTEKYLRGHKGAELLSKLKIAGTEEEKQRLLQKALSENIRDFQDRLARIDLSRKNKGDAPLMNPDMDMEPEINLGGGRFNFNWSSSDGKRGTASATFRPVGQNNRVDVISVRDRFGREFEPTKQVMDEIQQQAFEYIEQGG